MTGNSLAVGLKYKSGSLLIKQRRAKSLPLLSASSPVSFLMWVAAVCQASLWQRGALGIQNKTFRPVPEGEMKQAKTYWSVSSLSLAVQMAASGALLVSGSAPKGMQEEGCRPPIARGAPHF